MVKEFNDKAIQIDGKTAQVKAFHVNSGDSMEDLKSGKIKPDMWSPGDESWLQLAAAHWRDVKQKTLYDGYEPLVNIPLVIAMWEPMARVLGYPGPIGWKDIAKLAASSEGWTAWGHPEWGKFRWGHAHPDANSGFLTILSEVYAALGKTEGITVDDLKDQSVLSFLKEFEGAVEHYGLSNTWIDDLMRLRGPAYLSATVQYENTIIESNAKYRNKPFKIVAIYPTEGNFWTRHPVVILKEEWVSPEKQEACRVFLDFLLSRQAQQRAMEMGLRPISKDIPMSAPIDEDHGVLRELTGDKAFQVPDETILKRVRDLWEEAKIPATVFLILDRSGSMKGEPLDNAKKGAVDFIKSMKPRDELKLVVFHNLITTLADVCPIGRCGETAISRLEGVFAEGQTSLYDVLHENYAALIALKKQNPRRRYALLILSDGKDTSSKTRQYDFLDALPKGEDFDAPKIYSIAYGPEADKALLTEIANRTNGRKFVSSAEEIVRTYKELTANF